MSDDEWALPEPPNVDVQAVRVVDTGQRWNRLVDGPMAGYWIVDNPVAVPPPQCLDWHSLLVHGKRLERAEPLWSEQQLVTS
jgi:hypothetical protein